MSIPLTICLTKSEALLSTFTVNFANLEDSALRAEKWIVSQKLFSDRRPA